MRWAWKWCGAAKILKKFRNISETARDLTGYGAYRTKIIAEIVNAYELGLEQILERASYYQANGADIIDLGCPVQGNFPGSAG